MKDLSSEILRIIRRELGLYNSILSVQQDLQNDLGIGSLEKARLIYALDQRFKIISNSNLSEIHTVGDCVKYVELEIKKTG